MKWIMYILKWRYIFVDAVFIYQIMFRQPSRENLFLVQEKAKRQQFDKLFYSDGKKKIE